MPMYEYECDACGHRFETLQRMSDDPLKDCPACEAPSLRKLISAAAFKLKGQGWYESDFKNPPKPKESKSDGGEQSGGSDKKESTGGTDTKTADGGSSDKSSGSNGKSTDAKASTSQRTEAAS